MNIRKIVLGGALVGALITGAGVSPASATVPERDPERYSPVGTAWGLVASDKLGVDTFLSQPGARPFAVERTTDGLWSVLNVDNNNSAYTRSPSGPFSWTTDESETSLRLKLNATPPKRPLDVEPYKVGTQTRFAATWVDNTGAAFKNWTWLRAQTATQIGNFVNVCGCRLVDIDHVGSGRYDIISVPAVGVDNVHWEYGFGLSELTLHQRLGEIGGRPIVVEPDGNGTFTAIAVVDGLHGSFQTNQSSTAGLPVGSRLIQWKNYLNSSGQSVWLLVYLRNG